MNHSICSLASLDIGDSATVDTISATGSMRRRLHDIGLIEGTEVKCILKSPGGDPAAYRIRGALIALRSEDADTVFVGKA